VVKFTILFVVLVLLQTLVLNHIFFLGYATPFLYVYFIIKLPVTIGRSAILLFGFALGLTIDIFCNTAGLNAVATTFIAFMRLPLQKLFFDKENIDYLNLGMAALGGSFMKYVAFMVLLHHAALILVEIFSYSDAITILLRILSSSILTFGLVYALEGLSYKTEKSGKK
jgi:rod shape-determining protein MreD